MESEKDIELYLDVMAQEGLTRNKGNLRFQMASIFGRVDFNNKKVLDIGGGSGLCSFYAACLGASKVLCLEPEDEGSSSRVIEKFCILREALGANNVEIESKTLQEYNSGAETFDIILLHNSINHLDETACINLRNDENSKAIYREILAKISSLANKDAKLIICDCSCHNFFALLKLRNPLMPTIEWHKHQPPKVWIDLLTQVGFSNPKIGWLTFNRMRWWGKLLTGNKIMSRIQF